MNPQVSIIIVNYNSQQYLGDCIDSIYTYVSDVSYEIIVVDNASESGSVQFIKQKYPGVKLFVNSENKGFGAANNIGSRHASGDYLFFLNPDTILLDNALLRFYQFIEEEMPAAVSCGGNLITRNGDPTTSYGNFPSVLQEFGDMGFRKFFKKYYDEYLSIGKTCKSLTVPALVSYIVGADIFIKKNIFQEVGGFDEAFFLYYEETDLYFRLHSAGYKSYVLPQVKIIHLEGSSLLGNGKLNIEKWAIWEKSKYHYFRKHKGKIVAGIVKVMQLKSLVLHSFFGSTKYPLRKALRITWKA